MAVLDVLNLNLGTEQNPNWVLHDLHDKRISTTAVTTATHLLATNAGVTAINPITAANVAAVVGAAIPKGSVTTIGDFNLVTDSGCYSCNPSSMQNTPVSAPQGILSVYPTATGLKQQLIATSGIWERVFYSQTWWDWNRTDNFGCNNTDELASLLGGVTTDVSDFSLATQGCVSRIPTDVDGGRPADCSTEYSFFLFKISSNYILGFSSETGISYIKTRTTTSSAWSAWQKISVDIPSFYKNYNDLSSLASAVGGALLTRRTRLTDFDLAVLKQAVAGQNLEKYGLRVGDQKTINGHTYVIAGLNPMKGTTTPNRVAQNHVGLIVIPHTTQKWNESGYTHTGSDGRGAGYANSDLHYYLTNTLLPLVQSDLGSANLLSHSKLLSNAVNQTGTNKMGTNSGCTSNAGWVANQYISALSEVQVYGSTIWSSSGFDTGEACRQLDVFRHYNHTEIFGSEFPWLRDVVSASVAANVSNNGHDAINSVSLANYVAALVLFK